LSVHFDLQALQGPFYERGIARYVAALVRELLKSGDSIRSLGTNPDQGPIHPLYNDLGTHSFTAPTTVERWDHVLQTGKVAYVCPSPYEGMKPIANLWPSFVIQSDVPLVAIVHDTIPLRFPEVFQRTRQERAFYAARTRLLSHADLFLTNSHCTAADLVADIGVDPRQVGVIGAGVDARFRPAENVDLELAGLRVELPALTKPYVLNVTGWPETKNVMGFLEALSLLPSEILGGYQFVLACRVPPDVEKLWRQRMRDLALPEGAVVITGFVSDELLLRLYQCAELLVCPSLYEGFGFPVAEAAACRRPAICSNVSSLPEILGFEAATFDPHDPSSIASRIAEALTNEQVRIDLLQAGNSAVAVHTWGAAAMRFTQCLERVHA
jgi:glycosyltransferase involved in cell wall biosynthesis